MPVHINLFHEEQRALKERQRDPVKLGILGTLLLIFCLLVYWMILSGTAAGKQAEVARLNAEWEKHREATETGDAKIAEHKKELEIYNLLDDKVKTRPFWAPLLQQFLENARRDIQFTQLVGTLSREGNFRITVEGFTAGTEPRSVAEFLRTSLEASLKKIHPESVVEFNNLESNPEPMEINGRKYSKAQFLIECRIINSEAKKTDQPPSTPRPPKR